VPHTVVSTDGGFKSKVRGTDETFSYTFTKAGTYLYYCSVHPKMAGQVVVVKLGVANRIAAGNGDSLPRRINCLP
jgi:hypothetical protein